jgi:RNA polymerase sigma-70 factor (ECF subfamily)
MLTMVVFTMTAEPLAQRFEDVFRKHYDLVHRTAFGITGRREDAEDVAQTVFLRLLRRMEAKELEGNLKAYLYRAAVNESLNMIRSGRRRPKTDMDHVDVPADFEGPARAETIHLKLYEAIAQLSPRAAEVLVLRYVHEYSDGQIAELLGTSRGTIAVSLYRSRAQLKKLLRALLGEE